MEPLGIPDLPDNAWESPGVTLSQKFGISTADAPDAGEANGTNVTSEEISMAVHDAKCREQAKVHQTIYDLNWQYAEQQLAKHKGEYDARLNAIKKKNEELKAYIEANRN
ncbi:MAG: hypothetical protein Q4A71_07300 [Actinomycetaceae bacterium]|nr:hypothetical protein [Actinomycetaceae bacterium]